MEAIWHRIVDNLLSRLDGPMHLRFILQPLMAVIFACLDGMKDAKLGKPAYFWAVIFHPEYRKELLKEGWKAIGKIFIIAIVIDLLYLWKEHLGLYPGEILIVAIMLAIVPYVLLRGPVNRIARMFIKKIN